MTREYINDIYISLWCVEIMTQLQNFYDTFLVLIIDYVKAMMNKFPIHKHPSVTGKRGVCYMLDPPDTCPYLSRDKIAEMSSAPLCMKTHRRHFGKIWYRNSVNFSSVNKLWSRKTHDSCNRMDVHISDMHFRYVFSSENDYLSNPLQKNCETKSAT